MPALQVGHLRFREISIGFSFDLEQKEQNHYTKSTSIWQLSFPLEARAGGRIINKPAFGFKLFSKFVCFFPFARLSILFPLFHKFLHGFRYCSMIASLPPKNKTKDIVNFSKKRKDRFCVF